MLFNKKKQSQKPVSGKTKMFDCWIDAIIRFFDNTKELDRPKEAVDGRYDCSGFVYDILINMVLFFGLVKPDEEIVKPLHDYYVSNTQRIAERMPYKIEKNDIVAKAIIEGAEKDNLYLKGYVAEDVFCVGIMNMAVKDFKVSRMKFEGWYKAARSLYSDCIDGIEAGYPGFGKGCRMKYNLFDGYRGLDIMTMFYNKLQY